MTIKTKIMLITVFGLALSTIVGTTWSFFSSKKVMIDKSYASITSARDSKSAQISKFFQERISDVNVISRSQDVKKLLYDLNNLCEELKVDHLKAFPVNHPLIKKMTEPHEDFFQTYIKEYGYHDLLLIDSKDAQVVYSVVKKSDYGANLDTGPLKKSGLGEVYRKVKKFKRTVLVDMRPYPPSAGPYSNAMFLGSPIIVNGKIDGILVLQIRASNIKKVMDFRIGYGTTQETYLVGQNKLLRSDSYIKPKTHSLNISFKNQTKIDTEATRDALSGKTDTKIVIDYNGNSVLSAYAPLKIGQDLNWAIISEIDEAEVLRESIELKNKMIITSILLLIIIVLFLYFTIQTILITPLEKFQKGLLLFFKYLNKKSDNIEPIESNASNNSDEIEEMIKIVNENISTAKVILDEEKEMMLLKDRLNENLDKKVNEQIEKNKQQEEYIGVQSRLAQMGEMISMIAHQWRQPLAAISSTTIDLKIRLDLNTKDVQAEQNKYLAEGLNDINTFVQNLTTTIDDFRNFYKQDKKSVTIKLEEIVLKSLKIINTSLANDNIKIKEEYNSKQEIELYDNEIMQVILNILKNAQDNFKDKDIKNQYIKITIENRTITICDNGGGIPKAIINKIFDPYFSTKNEMNGTGLGLYMSKTIIEEHHNGKLSVKNIDDGVCFMIDFGKISENI